MENIAKLYTCRAAENPRKWILVWMSDGESSYTRANDSQYPTREAAKHYGIKLYGEEARHIRYHK